VEYGRVSSTSLIADVETWRMSFLPPHICPGVRAVPPFSLSRSHDNMQRRTMGCGVEASLFGSSLAALY
jgi:hypothetical protein